MSNKYSFINDNISDLLLPIVTNQNILRYIHYLDNDPLNSSKPNINNPYVIDDGVHTSEAHIFLDFFNETIVTEQKIYMFFTPIKPKRTFTEISTINSYLFSLSIVIPSTYWSLRGQGKLRAYAIADEISQMIDGKRITGIGEVIIESDGAGKLDNGYRILELVIKVDNSVFNYGSF